MDISEVDRINHMFTYHPPKPEQQPHFAAITEATRRCALVIGAHSPRTSEQTLAFRALQQARMWANCAIACSDSSQIIELEHQELTAIEQANQAIVSQKQALDAVYAERNQCVALIARMASIMGDRVGLRTSSDFEPGWQKCIMIDLPSGQVSWHLKDSELPLFDFPDYPDPWDGHSTEEKYRRVNEAYKLLNAKDITALNIDAQQLINEAHLRIELAELATELLQNTPDDELNSEYLQLKREVEASQAPKQKQPDQAGEDEAIHGPRH